MKCLFSFSKKNSKINPAFPTNERDREKRNLIVIKNHPIIETLCQANES